MSDCLRKGVHITSPNFTSSSVVARFLSSLQLSLPYLSFAQVIQLSSPQLFSSLLTTEQVTSSYPSSSHFLRLTLPCNHPYLNLILFFFCQTSMNVLQNHVLMVERALTESTPSLASVLQASSGRTARRVSYNKSYITSIFLF